jgi:lipopolysaccharide export system permease protein
MIFTKIWERYFLRQTVKIFFLFLFGFYGLYVLLDYANHTATFHSHLIRFKINDVLLFYAYEFVKRMDVLIPFAILIACIKTLCNLNVSNELVALMACGIKLKTLMRPFLCLGLFFTLVIYMNTEFLLPAALKQLKHIDEARAQAKQKRYRYPIVQHLTLEDNTTLIFQSYDPVKEFFFDSYWIRSIDDVYRIKYLAPYTSIPTGYYVDHLKRNNNGTLVVEKSFTEKTFSDMHFNQKTLMETVTSPDELPLSELRTRLPNHKNTNSEKEARVLTAFHYKLAMPWLCLLAVIGPAPFCVRFSRMLLPIFFIYACSIFGLVAFYLIVDSSLVLGERQVLSPFVAIWTPFAFFFGLFGWRFARL